jgi:hypothetical protein
MTAVNTTQQVLASHLNRKPGRDPAVSRAKPTFLDSLIRFMAWSAVIGTLATPVLLIALFNSQIIVSFPGLRGSDFEATVRKLMPGAPGSGIVTADGRGLAAQAERLRSMTARPEMAAGAITRLHLLALAFDDKPEPTPPRSPLNPSGSTRRPAVDPDGYRRMTLNVAHVPKEGVVVVADQPIRWTIVGAASSWPVIGFEGMAPFDIVNGRPNLIAGFRIRAFGARDTARAADPFHADPAARRALCQSVRAWSEHFGLAMTQVTFRLIANASGDGTDPRAFLSDGDEQRTWTGPWIDGFCNR